MELLALSAKIFLDASDYEKGVNSAAKSGEALASKLKKSFNGLVKIGQGALGVAAGGIAAVTKASVENYAEYEQLVGGVETLFKDSADTVKEYAENAYRTAGMSANQYMETVTSFSASLLQSLGGDTVAAAGVADMAITDMADNANKMGTSIESIQSAYQGFAKQNYTMLDNLKLGYGGTATEMARLINDSGVLGDKIIDLSDTAAIGSELAAAGFSKMVEAIHVVQTEIGITGTTAVEASGTISGSIASMKAAWVNLTTGIADENQNTEVLVETFVDTIATTAENLIPRIKTVVESIFTTIDEKMPALSAAFKTLSVAVASVTAGMVAYKSASNIAGIIDALRKVTESQTIAQAALNAVMNANPFVLIATLIAGVVTAIGTLWVTNEDFREGVISAWGKIKDFLSNAVSAIATFFTETIPDAANKAVEWFKAIPEKFKEIGKNIITGVWDGIVSMATWIQDKVSNFFGGIVDGVKGLLGIHSPSRVFAGIGENMALGLGEGWDDEYGRIKRDIENGMEFGTASVDFASSGVGKSSSSVINSVMAGAQNGGGGTYNINLVVDGRNLAHVVFDPLRNESKLRGVSLV